MLSQLRNLTASVSQELKDEENTTSQRSSPDSQHNPRQASLSSSQLAESALANLRKSLSSQRSGSPVNKPATSPPMSSSPSTSESRPAKSRLEDRLRAAATFAIGDLSNATTPAVSTGALPSRAATPMVDHPLSPSLIPLPASLPSSPIEEQMQSTPIVAPNASQGNAADAAPADPLLAPGGQETSNPALKHDPLQETSEPPASSDGDSVDSESVSQPSAEDSKPEAEVTVPLPLDTQATSDAKDSSDSHTATPTNQSNADTLQERLKLVEQRFTDVSTSFKRLQAEKRAADSILKEFTPVESVQDANGLREYLKNNDEKLQLYRDEVRELAQKMDTQEGRIKELREMHLMESKSQSAEIEKLRAQLQEAEALVKASQDLSQHSETQSAAQSALMADLKKEVENQKTIAREEEEKRVKAISLLKTVRQKSVKAEKEKEEAVKELAAMKEKDRLARESEKEAVLKLQKEIEEVNSERDSALKGLRAQFDKELAGTRERYEKELASTRLKAETGLATVKNTHSQEISSRNSKITSLEKSVNNLAQQKNTFFEQLQLRQAELESSQSHLDSLQSQNTELEYQLREAQERLSQMTDEAMLSREADQPAGTSAEEIAQLLSSTESKYEVKIADLKRTITVLERERNEGEVDWSRKLREKSKEADELRRIVDSSAKTRQRSDETTSELKIQIEALKADVEKRGNEMIELQAQIQQLKEERGNTLVNLKQTSDEKLALEARIEEFNTRDAQLRTANKNLREELRKVQSSAALLEKQRNPGVGYWTGQRNGDARNSSRTSLSSDAPPSSTTTVASPPPVTSSRSDEEVNLEYLRNVVLQFLEHKEMRPNLVRVLSIILQFTPQETRRLMAKI